jgi:hypothetical protein
MLWSGLPTLAMYKRTKRVPVYVRYGELARRSKSERLAVIGSNRETLRICATLANTSLVVVGGTVFRNT